MGLLPVPLLSRKGPTVQAGDCRTKWWLKEMGAGCGGTLQHATTAFSWGCEFALKSIGESQFMVRRKLALSHRLCETWCWTLPRIFPTFHHRQTCYLYMDKTKG